MKRAVFDDVSLKAFWEIMNEFATALETTFPSCGETKDWGLYMRNVVKGNLPMMRENIGKWCDGMHRPLQKAKYAKAVQSITGSPAMVYHAVAYHDIDAMELSFESLQALQLSSKLKSTAMDDEAKAIFWQYMDELNKHALAHAKKTPPKVPTPDEISADIQRRRGQAPATAQGGPVLQQGLKEVWQQLCESRGCVGDVDNLQERLSTAIRKSFADNKSIGDGCRDRDPVAFERLAADMTDLRTDAPVTDEQWGLLEKALGLAVMEDSIPAPMMRGIESVANQLVKDLASGKTDFASLDIEAIGQKVLSEVDESDVSSFAGNIDKILPALSRLQKP